MRKISHSFISSSFVCLIACTVGDIAHAATSLVPSKVQTRVVAQSGVPAPDLEFAFELDQLIDATINDRGDVVYRALTNRSFQGSQRSGLWIDPAQEGQPDRFLGVLDFFPAPGLPSGQLFSGVSLPVLSDTGDALATQFLNIEPARRSTGVWLATKQAVVPVLLPGQQAPGLPSGELVLNSPTGRAFTSQGFGLVTALTDQGNSPLWRYFEGDLELLEVTRSPFSLVPGFDFTNQTFGAKINDNGTVAIVGEVFDGSQRFDVLYQVAQDGTRELLARSDGGVPALPGALAVPTFIGLSALSINDSGTVSFNAEISSPGGSRGRGIWYKKPGEPLKPLVTVGMRTPADDATFEGVGNVIVSGLNNYMNDLGQIGFQGFLELDNGETAFSSWIGSEDGLELVAIDGDQAPGFAPGITMQMGMPMLNDLGMAILSARLNGPGITLETDEAIYYRLAGGQPNLLIREGQLFEVSPGDIRRIVEFTYPIAEAGRVVGINNRNEVVLTLQFEDDSSAVVVFAIVPEPSAALLMVASGIGLMSVLQRRRGVHVSFG